MAGNILLVGFMGAGKSTVGRLLAKRLNRCFVETDEMIVAKAGKPIPRIFEEDGEAYFRRLEAELIPLLTLKQNEVISAGGGFPCHDGAMEALKALGTVFWLKGDMDLLYARALKSGTRPILSRRTREEIEALYRQRESYYRQADVVVETTGLSLDQVVDLIISELRRREA